MVMNGWCVDTTSRPPGRQHPRELTQRRQPVFEVVQRERREHEVETNRRRTATAARDRLSTTRARGRGARAPARASPGWPSSADGPARRFGLARRRVRRPRSRHRARRAKATVRRALPAGRDARTAALPHVARGHVRVAGRERGVVVQVRPSRLGAARCVLLQNRFAVKDELAALVDHPRLASQTTVSPALGSTTTDVAVRRCHRRRPAAESAASARRTIRRGRLSIAPFDRREQACGQACRAPPRRAEAGRLSRTPRRRCKRVRVAADPAKEERCPHR